MESSPPSIPPSFQYAPMGKVWHAVQEALSCIRDHHEDLPTALQYAREEFFLTPQEEDRVRLQLLVETEE